MKRNMNKTECPVSRKAFLSNVKPLMVVIDGQPRPAVVKEFSTGSFGWFLSDKVVITIDGVPCKVQVSASLIVVGSKEAR